MASKRATGYRKQLGLAIRTHREQLGISQEAFAYRCRMHRTYMGRLERGEVNIGLDNLVAIAQVLGLPLSRLVAEAEGD
jgi:transcriptional regulator with XRE-family HTH domain